MTHASLTATLLALAFIAPQVDAGERNPQGGIVVRYAHEMLDNPADAAKVYDKLRLASRRVCGLIGGVLTVQERTVANRCFEQTLADAVRKIDRPMLTSLYASRAGKVG